jgi:hypothetical protein
MVTRIFILFCFTGLFHKHVEMIAIGLLSLTGFRFVVIFLPRQFLFMIVKKVINFLLQKGGMM